MIRTNSLASKRIHTSNVIYSEQLNHSSSKMLYSFSKSIRFNKDKPDHRKQYTGPSSINKRAASFGLSKGNRLTTSTTSIPGPNQYNLASNLKDRKRGITFGNSRQKSKHNSFMSTSRIFNPGPSHYHPKHTQMSSIKYSLGQKYNIPDSKKGFPGPSDYKTIQLKNNRGKTILSQYRSNTSGKFNKYPKIINPQKQVPGPGSYDLKKSQKLSAKYSSTGACRFTSRRKTGGIYSNKKVPGPGNYNHYTQFHSKQF